MFVEGFFTALGAMAAIAAVSIVVGVPFIFYMKRNLRIWKETIDVIKRHNERHPHEE